jgi:hypothetical protein
MASLDPTTRSLISRIGASERWAREPDWVAATAPARAGMARKFRDEVAASVASLGITLSEAELERRASHLRRAHMLRLAVKSAEARAQRKAGTNP